VSTSSTGAPGWWLDERAHAGEEHLDPAYVAGYDRKAGTDPAEDLELLRGLGMGAGSTLVDLGAGTGVLSLAAARFCGRVVAVDVSPAMLAALRARAERLRLTNLELVPGGFLSYEHRGPAADFVYSRNALHHLPDFWKGIALQRVAAMLRPGGVLRLRDLVFACDPAEAEPVIEAWLASAASGRRKAGRVPSSRRTSATSTAPTPGCWRPCSRTPASRSRTPDTPPPACTPRTAA
jgi:SAM-dependent methyltransferase